MGADLNNIVKCQKLTDDHVQFLIYQILRGLKVSQPWGNSHHLHSYCDDYNKLYLTLLFVSSQYIHSADIIHRVSNDSFPVNVDAV